MLSLARLGWGFDGWTIFVTPKGNLDLSLYGPRDIKILVERAAQDWTWTEASKHRPAYAELVGTTLIAPVKTILKTAPSSTWSRAAKGCLRSLCADAWPPEGICKLCGGEASQWHSCWDCPAIAPFRRQYGLTEQLEQCDLWGSANASFATSILPH